MLSSVSDPGRYNYPAVIDDSDGIPAVAVKFLDQPLVDVRNMVAGAKVYPAQLIDQALSTSTYLTPAMAAVRLDVSIYLSIFFVAVEECPGRGRLPSAAYIPP